MARYQRSGAAGELVPHNPDQRFPLKWLQERLVVESNIGQTLGIVRGSA